ncbi:HAD family hydrolase [Microbispora rosea]|uniref:HAD family hydrolase n=1 Tax=Microbispora rosea TaxID=58117 RepID=UPI00379B9E72
MFFAKVRERFALLDFVEELWGSYRKRMPHLVRCPEVLDGLVQLRRFARRVAIVTSGTADNQLGKIQQTGLAEAMDAYALSGVEGVWSVRDRGQALWHDSRRGRMGVGDNLTADIAGGRAAGLRTIWIDRGAWPGVDHQADHVVTDVLHAIEILHGSNEDGGSRWQQR